MVKSLHCLIGIVLFLAILNAGNGFTLDRSASIERQEDSWPKISLFHGNQRKNDLKKSVSPTWNKLSRCPVYLPTKSDTIRVVQIKGYFAEKKQTIITSYCIIK
uniref:U-scoloptoxin(24)-Er1a n=1 Tax=Ethmostigmus rubripes TaxID=62613 RepID=TXO1A_ETHRU|nr:RecName: Full=U-scoloptoxin(24)-Er1a; Short=U-SLPTX(24)-Er1a; Flags: Precursor [Ethmostigmus rubripes]